ncbi:MAG TPA: type I-C CRISPR-associated protein Cas8c/Csd1 [Roseiarcus sp.]|nr:type I-C CRISPR-associated protein Cas8c/Csd1 [Roseiarcus sp.]
MSILAALAKAYERLPDAPPYGYSAEKVGFLISLDAGGAVAHVIDLREGEGRKKTAPQMVVPQGAKRASGISPNFLWDKTAYVLGVTAAEGKRTADEHAAFVKRHLDALADATDPGLAALGAFLTRWTPDQFIAPVWPDDMKDQNVAFTYEPDRRTWRTLQDRPAARSLWQRLAAEGDRNSAICLVSGEAGPVARLHPAVKGVWGAQSSGASIVSFNLDAFTSYGHEQGDNAPISEAAAFAYTTALNRFLERDSGHRIQIGDASTVFWADASDATVSAEAEALFLAWVDPSATQAAVNEASEAAKIAAKLDAIRQGKPLAEINPALEQNVPFHVLALAPNAARLSIRFYLEDDFGAIATNYRRYCDDMRIAPPPRDAQPALWKYLAETAVLGKRENVPPNLAGEWLRSILTGTHYPQTLLATILMRIRADGDVSALRVSMLKAVLIRNLNRKDAPVALDSDNRDKGYLLGRLFAVYEHIQSAALGAKVNATVKDKFYASASAQPRKVFALLERGSANHLAKVGKASPGRKVNLEKRVGAIMDLMSPSEEPFPAALGAEQQALFGLGYYHQRNAFFTTKPQDAPAAEDQPE